MAKPWITPAIKTSITKKKLFNKYMRTKHNYYYSKFKMYRNKLNHLIKSSKKLYYNKYFADNQNNIKNIWKGIKQIIYLKPRNINHLPMKIIKNNKTITDSKSIAKLFNEYFTNIGKELAESIPPCQKHYYEYLNDRLIDSFFMSPTTSDEIEQEISSLNSRISRAL